MKKTILFAVLIMLSVFQLKAQTVNIPDPNFKSILLANSAINTNGNNEIEVAEATAYTGAIIVNNENISDMTGIEAFTQIQTLVCSENQITTIDISNNTVLSSFICSNNQLTSLDVSSNTALTLLLCDNNQLTSLNLNNNTALVQLNCNNNQLTSLDLSSNTSLTNVRCSHNQIATLNLSNTQGLKNLYCDNNVLNSLDLNDCVSLTTLYCDTNQIVSLDFSSIGPIQYIQCSSNNLTTLNLGPMPVLEYINCSYNQLSTLDISGVGTSYLKYLICSENQLTTLDASNNTGLVELICSENQLTSIDINGLNNLDSLDCSSNLLTSIDLTNTGANPFTYLDCSNNQLTSLNTTGINNIITLNCSDNLLTNIDLNTLVLNLYCNDNHLFLLDLSDTYWINLDCQNNNLDSLNVANGSNVNVQSFNSLNNPNVECIVVDDATYSTQNWTNIDPGTGFSDGIPSVGIDTRIECEPFVWIDGNTYTNDNNTATYKINCDSIVILNLTIENINPEVTSQNNILTATETAQGTTYQWIDCQNNNAPISGAANQSFEPTQNGEYAVVLTSQTGCTDTSSCHVINTLNIENNPKLDKQITLYPNPTSKQISIQTDLDIAEVYLLDLQGKQLQTSNLKEVDLSKLSSGIYLVKVKLKNNETWTSKVIKN